MPKITVQPSAFSGEEVVQQTIDAAASQLPAGSEPPHAEVERDAAGKVVKVNVNLPDDIAQGDLDNAKAKINENPGVAKASEFPKTFTEDLEAFVSGQSIYGLFDNKLRSGGDALQASGTNPLNGSISALDPNGFGFFYSGQATNFGLTSISSHSFECKWKISAVSDYLRVRAGNKTFDLKMPGSGNYLVRVNGTQYDTGVASAAVGTTVTAKIMVTPVAAFFSIDGAVIYTAMLSTPASTTLQFMGSAGNAGTWRIDDIKLEVLDGILA